jgi:integrase
MAVLQLPDGRWVCEHARGRNPDKPTSKRTYFGRGEEGRQAAMEFNTGLGLATKKKVADSSPLFVELAKEYQIARAGVVAETTVARWNVRMKGTIFPAIGEKMAHQLTPQEIDRYVAKRSRTVKRNTIHREVSDIRSILRWAVSRRLIAANPMAGYDMPKLDNAVIRPPSREEIEAIMKHAVPHLRRAILLSYNTGLRPGRKELLSLTWDAVDLIGGTITVTSAEKGGLRERTVPLVPAFLEELGRWYDEDQKEGARYLIHYAGGKVDSLKTAWKNAKKRARITRRLRLYDLRHAFATTLLGRGGDLQTVSQILGHRSIIMTMNYQHVSTDLKKRTVSLLDPLGVAPPVETSREPA